MTHGGTFTPQGWTGPRVEQLKKLYDAGLSCSQIAAELGGGFSRNGVIGKVHRLGLVRRGNGGGRGPSLRTAEAVKPRPRITRVNSNSNARRVTVGPEPVELKALRCAEVVPLNITLEALTSETCHWPYGDLPPFAFCGHATLGETYCRAHHALSTGRGTSSERAAGYAPKLVTA